MALETGYFSPDIDVSRLVINPKIKEKFKDLENVKIFRIDSTNEWKDEELLCKKKLWLPKLEDLESDGARDAYIRSAIECLCKKVSRSSVGALITLAWNLVSPDNPNRDVFTRNDTNVKEVDKSLSTLCEKVFTIGKNAPAYKLPYSYEKKRQAVAYVAGSALRLITKPPENYMKAFDHISRSYRNFYREEFPIEMTLDAACVRGTHDLLQQEILKNSVIPFLFHFDELEGNDKRMCKMLYEQHLSYAGIHAYPLFITAAETLELDADVLMALLDHRTTSDGLEVIQHILDQYECPHEKHGSNAERQEKHLHRTWKYARLFDERVFAELQTKNSAFLVTVLAYLNRILGTSGAENVLRIKQIEHIVQNDGWGSRYEAIAKRLYEWVAMRKETPECRTDEWKSIEINVENYVKKRRENRAPNKQLEA